MRLIREAGPLARPGFRRFWTAQTVSVLGDQVSLLALSLTAVLTLHLSAGGMGLLTAVGYALGGLGVMLYDVNDNTLRAVRVPHRLRGRASGSNRFLTYGVRPLGALAGGWLGSTIGLQPTLWIAAVGGLLGVAWLWPSPIRRLREVPTAANQ